MRLTGYLSSKNKLIITLLGVLFLIGSACLCNAQEYLLGPEDELSVTVLRHPELSVEQVTVTTDGKIQLPMAGEIPVSGMTASQVSTLIESSLKERIVNPEVTVAVKQAREQRIFVLGSVGQPGIFDLKPGWRVTEALAAAGGLKTRPELTDASILRLNKETIPLNLKTILNQGDQKNDIALQPGDVLSVTERTIRASVAGSVKNPGAYDVPTGAGVVEAVALAGGADVKAALTKVVVKHTDGTSTPVNLYRVMIQGQTDGNLKIQAGDLVVVPQSQAKVAVLGAVKTPGYYEIDEGTSCKSAEAVAMAGGPEFQARISDTAIIRQENGKSVRKMVDLKRVLKEGRTNEDMPVQDGDVIYIPGPKVDWDFTMRAISSITSIAWYLR